MSERGFDFNVIRYETDILAILPKCSALMGGIQPVAGEAGEKKLTLSPFQTVALILVNRSSENEIAIGVKAMSELVPLVAQVALDRELLAPFHLATTTKLRFKARFAQIADVPRHARNTQAIGGRILRRVIPTQKLWIPQDRLPPHFIEGYLQRGMSCATGGHPALRHAIRVQGCQSKSLHSSHTPTCDQAQLRNLEVVKQIRMAIRHIFDRYLGKPTPPGSSIGCQTGWPGGSLTPTQRIHPNDIELVRIDRFACPKQALPPAKHIGIAAEGVADQDRIVPSRIQAAPSLVANLDFRKNPSSPERCLAEFEEPTTILCGSRALILLKQRGIDFQSIVLLEEVA